VADCVVCGEPVPVSDACPHCAAPVCAAHREPTAHDCPGVESDSARWYTDPDAGRNGETGGTPLSDPRRLTVGVAVALLVAVALAAVLAVGSPTADARIDPDRTASLVVAEVNDARTERGLAPLERNGSLARVASAHSADMAARGYVNHTAPNGSGVADRYERFGYDCRIRTGDNGYATGGENLAYTYADAPVRSEGGVVSYDGNESRIARGIVTGWMNSPDHRRNLLRPYWQNEGLGVVLDPEDGRTQVVVTQNFC
jgi:uncharacterized protein YkwD